MTLRGEIDAFPLETVVQLIHSTSKTGQLEVRGSDATGGTLGFDGGRLVAAIAGDDVGEPALGAVFAVEAGSFEFIPWSDAPSANLSGDLDQLLDRAVVERDRIIAIRKVIPDDRSRFRLSERAAEKGDITLQPDQWRTLLAVNGERDIAGVAEHLRAGKLATRASIATLVEAGFIDVLEPAAPAAAPPPVPAAQWAAPAAEPEPQTWAPAAAEPAIYEPAPPPAVEPAPPAPPEWAPAAPHWEAPPPPPATPSAWESAPAQEWERAAPATPAPQWEPAPRSSDLAADLAAALDARMSAPPAPVAEPESAPPPVEIPPAQDERLAALSGVFGPAQGGPIASAEPAAQVVEPVVPAQSTDRINEWSRMAASMQTEPAPEEKKKGRFGFLKRDEPARDAGPAPVAAVATPVSPIAAAPAAGRAGQLASLANALLGEYNSGQYGKGRLDDRMANLLMRVDEQADPIDRPLPIVDDRIDSQALDRENMPEEQSVPYLAILVSQIYEDAARTFGKDKAKKGYRAATQQVFGTDTAALNAPDVAGRLPKV